MKNQSVTNKMIGFTVAAAMLTTAGAVGVFAKNAVANTTLPKAAKQETKFEHKKMDNLFKDIKREVKNLDNGVEITMTSDKAEVVAKLQAGPANPKELPANSKVTINKENLTNGVKITITSTDATEVKKIQERETFGGPGKGHKGGHGQGMDFLNKVTRNVENTSTGVVVTMTSTDAEVVKKLQDGPAEPKWGPKDEKKSNVSFTKENLANGVKITISSTDASEVTKIQEHETKMGEMAKKFIKRGLKAETSTESTGQ